MSPAVTHHFTSIRSKVVGDNALPTCFYYCIFTKVGACPLHNHYEVFGLDHPNLATQFRRNLTFSEAKPDLTDVKDNALRHVSTIVFSRK